LTEAGGAECENIVGNDCRKRTKNFLEARFGVVLDIYSSRAPVFSSDSGTRAEPLSFRAIKDLDPKKVRGGKLGDKVTSQTQAIEYC
jgi:hypothetical protein